MRKNLVIILPIIVIFVLLLTINGGGSQTPYLGQVLALLGFVAVVFQTWIYARQTSIMSGQLKATEIAADAARQQASSMIEIELPILMIVGIETSDGQKPGRVCIKIKNYGRTPAIITADCLETKITKNLPPVPSYSPDTVLHIFRDTVIESGGEYDFFRRIHIEDSQWEQIRRAEITLWAYGFIDYIDFRKREHRDGFCLTFIPARKTNAEKFYDKMPPSSLTWVRTGDPGYTYNRYKTDED